MKNLDPKWLWSIGAVLVLLNLYSLYERNKVEQANEQLKVEKTNLTNKLHTIQNNIRKRTILQFESGDQEIDLSLPLIKPSLDDTTNLSNLIKEEVKLVFKYSDINCQVCVDQVFSKINPFIESVGERRVIFLAEYENPRDLYTFQRVNNIDHTIYNLGDQQLGLSVEQVTTVPVLFLAYPDGQVDYVFLPDKSLPNLTEQYFQFIEQKME